MGKKKFTTELKSLFDYINNVLLKDYKSETITTEYFIVSVLENPNCIANHILSKIMVQDSVETVKEYFYKWMEAHRQENVLQTKYDTLFEKSIQDSISIAAEQKYKYINSGIVLYSIINNNDASKEEFKKVGVGLNQINDQILTETENFIEASNKQVKGSEKRTKNNISLLKKDKKSNTSSQKEKGNSNKPKDYLPDLPNDIINVSDNLNKMAKNGEIENIYGNEDVYKEIFSVLAKKNKNNVVLTGKRGVGKTSIVQNIANLIVKNQAPKRFLNKILIKIDFNKLLMNTGMRGNFEMKLQVILHTSRNNGNFIFFLDGIDDIINSKNEGCIEDFLKAVLVEKSIMVICSCSNYGYVKNFKDNPILERFVENINIEEPSEDICCKILKQHTEKLSIFHDVKYNEDDFVPMINLCKRYITERSLPDSVIDVIDKTGARLSLSVQEPKKIKELRDKITLKNKEMEEFLNQKEKDKDYESYDNMKIEQLKFKTKLELELKEYNLNKKVVNVTLNDIKETISQKVKIPIQEISIDDKQKLQSLDSNIKKIVIGQDEAINAVCRTIRRQRLGLNNPLKPSVLFFGGSTGVGKTYLCKTLAKELWGNEKQIIRLDMSEFSEPSSVTKLFGAPPSYIGYNDAVSLADKLKEKKHCILLLDEIEKACDKVFNVFLQMFDEGRITDNKNNTVDCRNIIVIMTSNIAAKEINNKHIGFNKVEENNNVKSTIEKELKKKFNPEFLNRIDEIIYFNKLSEENIKQIIKIELNNIQDRIKTNGYSFDKTMFSDKCINSIYEELKNEKEFGARPIKRKLQTLIEDKIVDKIISESVIKNNKFSYKDFWN